nr:hypothetical protein CFP56_49507 [Quercus suber]
MLLARELRASHIPIPATPQIPGRGPIIPPFKFEYLLIPPGPPGSWGPFAQALGPSQDLRYALDISGGAGTSTSPFVGDDDSDDDDDTDQFIRGDNSP